MIEEICEIVSEENEQNQFWTRDEVKDIMKNAESSYMYDIIEQDRFI